MQSNSPQQLAPDGRTAEAVQQRTLELLAAHVDRLSCALEEHERMSRELSAQVTALAEKQNGGSPHARALVAARALGEVPPQQAVGAGEAEDIARLRAEVWMWEQHWINLQETASWQVAMALRRLRQFFAPDGSLRARLWRILLQHGRG